MNESLDSYLLLLSLPSKTIEKCGNTSKNSTITQQFRRISRNTTEIGKVMNDLFCRNAEDMNYEVLSKRVGYFKNEPGGIDAMCEILEEVKRESAEESVKEKK